MELEKKPFCPPRLNKRVQRLGDAPFIDELIAYYKSNRSTIEWSNSPSVFQSAVHTHLVNSDDVLAGCGSVENLPSGEFAFKHLALRYHDTVVQKLVSRLPVNIRRLRWMRLMGKSCNAFHCNQTPRIHIPLITTTEACVVFPDDGAVHLEVGGIYVIDTTHYHSFLNGGDQERVHLVGVLEPFTVEPLRRNY